MYMDFMTPYKMKCCRRIYIGGLLHFPLKLLYICQKISSQQQVLECSCSELHALHMRLLLSMTFPCTCTPAAAIWYFGVVVCSLIITASTEVQFVSW